MSRGELRCTPDTAQRLARLITDTNLGLLIDAFSRMSAEERKTTGFRGTYKITPELRQFVVDRCDVRPMDLRAILQTEFGVDVCLVSIYRIWKEAGVRPNHDTAKPRRQQQEAL